MSSHKLNTKNYSNQYENIKNIIFEHFCSMMASGNPTLEKLNIHGKFIFNQNLIDGKIISKNEITINLLNLAKDKFSNEDYEYFYKNFSSILTQFLTNYNRIIRDTVSKLNGGIISGDLIQGLKTGNIENISNVIQSVQKSAKAAIAAREKREEGLKSLQEAKQERLDEYRQQNTPFGSRIKQKIDNILDYFVPVNATDLLIQKIAYGFVEDDIEIKSKADLNKYYGNESGLTNTPENLQKLFDCYLVEKDFYERTKIRPSIKLEIIKIAQNAKQKGNTFLNDVQRENFLLNNLKGKTDNITKQMVKLFVDNLK